MRKECYCEEETDGMACLVCIKQRLERSKMLDKRAEQIRNTLQELD